MTAPLRQGEVRAAPLWTLPADARVALVSPYGGGNLGDAAILESAIRGIRRRLSQAAIFGLTLNPASTTDRHGIPAFPCTGMRLRLYHASSAARSQDEGAAPPAGESGGGVGRTTAVAVLKRVARAVPGLPEIRTVGQSLVGDWRQRQNAARWLAGCRVVLVAGGGQLDDYWGGAFGHPYVLWELASLGRRAGARFVVASVGFGTLQTPLARKLVARALAAADYCSFRDEGSKSLAAFANVPGSVVPDLAYALPWREVAVRTAGLDPPAFSVNRPPRVALSPMSYGAPDLWPEVDPAKYERHVASVVELGARMLGAGWQVVLVHSDSNDRVPAAEVAARLRQRLPPDQQARLDTPATDRLPALLGELARVDLMVAARLHGVILAHVVGRPVLALSYERKVATVMREMNHMDYCLELETMDPTQAFRKVEAMVARRVELEADVAAKVAARRAAVETQWDRLFAPEAQS